jgi:hypothetical protein
VREGGDLGADSVDHFGHGVADARHGDARAEVEDLVAVDVLEDRADGTLDVDGESVGETGAHDGLAALVQRA